MYMSRLIRPFVRTPAPRGLGPIFAMAGEGDIAALRRSVDGHTETMNSQFIAIRSEIDKIIAKQAAMNVTGGTTSGNAAGWATEALQGIDPKEIAALRALGRGDETAIKALSTDSDPDGGWTSLPTIEKTIQTIARTVSPIRDLANVITLATGSTYETIVDPSLVQAQWVGERQARTQTTGPKLVKIQIPVNEMEAQPAATQTLIDDSFQDIGQWLSTRITTAFSILEATGFTTGDGVNKPMGFLSYPTDPNDDFARPAWNYVQYVAAGSATPTDAQLAQALIAISTKLRVPYRSNARWLLPRSLVTRIRQIVDTTGKFLWSSDGRLNGDIQDLLCGFPISYSEDLPTPGANSLSIAFGDFKQFYTIVDRLGIRLVRDNFTQKPFVLFYTTKRVGGGVVDFNAVKLLKWSAS